jgi:hypothetical protein
MTSNRPRVLTFDEKKAAEAAFRGLPPDEGWSASAHEIYYGILAKMEQRSVEDTELVSAV